MLDEKRILRTFSCLQRKDYRTMTSRLARGTAFQEMQPGAGLKTGDFVKENLEGATVERLTGQKRLAQKLQTPTAG